MTKYITVTVKKSDNSYVTYGVLANDSNGDASLAAINKALTEAGAGSETQSCNVVGKVDLDATV